MQGATWGLRAGQPLCTWGGVSETLEVSSGTGSEMPVYSWPPCPALLAETQLGPSHPPTADHHPRTQRGVPAASIPHPPHPGDAALAPAASLLAGPAWHSRDVVQVDEELQGRGTRGSILGVGDFDGDTCGGGAA